jgi:hypothetical protein
MKRGREMEERRRRRRRRVNVVEMVGGEETEGRMGR